MTATPGSTVLAGVAEYAGVALGVSADDVGEWTVEAVDYEFASPTTAGLYRVRGDGWSLFLKVLQSYRRWPLFHVLPTEWLQDLPVDEAWRYEADIYTDGLAGALPTGMRLCDVYGMTDLGDDRLVLALEDVSALSAGWDSCRFGRAAGLLGRLNARLTRDDALRRWRSGARARPRICTTWAGSFRRPSQRLPTTPYGPIRCSLSSPTLTCAPISSSWPGSFRRSSSTSRGCRSSSVMATPARRISWCRPTLRDVCHHRLDDVGTHRGRRRSQSTPRRLGPRRLARSRPAPRAARAAGA